MMIVSMSSNTKSSTNDPTLALELRLDETKISRYSGIEY